MTRRLVFAILCFVTTAASAQSVTFTSSNLPIIVIDTKGGIIVDEPKIEVSIGIIDNGPGKTNKVTDAFNIYNGKAGIEIRGSSSQMFPKKQYSLELHDATGADLEVSLFGMPKESDWVMFAPYNDKSLVRDALAYRMGRDMGRYASRQKYFELVINGDYMGVFVFFEKVKRGKNRVNIDKLSADEVTGDNLTGGYIIKLDKTTGGTGDGFASAYPPEGKTTSSPQKTFFQYEYPKSEDIVPAQKSYIKTYMDDFEKALAGDNYLDPVNGYSKYIDVDSFIDFLIMMEASKNPDGYRLSTFMYKKKDSEGGKLAMGPIWDFNLGFGNVNYCTQGTPTGMVTDFNSICPDDGWLIPFWWRRLLSDPAFRSKLNTRWKALRANVFSTAKLHGFVDSVATVLNGGPQQRNFQRWPVIGVYVWPNYFYKANSFDAEVSWLKDWINQRMGYLDIAFGQYATGVEKNLMYHEANVQVSPNPFNEQLQFSYEIPGAGSASFEIFDNLGRRVEHTSQRHEEPGEYSLTIPLNVSPGLYHYRYNFEGQTKVGHIVKL